MQYTATGHRSQYFELYSNINEPLGRLNYTEWFSAKAEIMMPDGDSYQLGPSNFWLTSIEMWKADACVAAAKRNWAMNVVITLGSSEYHFGAEGLMNRHYALTTDTGQEIAVLRPNFQWSEFKFNYDIETDSTCSELANPAIILFLIYCCNYISKRSGAGFI